MKVKCPNCSSVGRVPSERIPTSGANIRCPSCSFVFFVGGPDRINVVSSSDSGRSSLPSMGQTQSLPLPDPTQFRRSAPSTDESVVQRMPTGPVSGAEEDSSLGSRTGRTAALPNGRLPHGDTSGLSPSGVNSAPADASAPERARHSDAALQDGGEAEVNEHKVAGSLSAHDSGLPMEGLPSSGDSGRYPKVAADLPVASGLPLADASPPSPTDSSREADYESAVRAALGGLFDSPQTPAAPLPTAAAAPLSEVSEARPSRTTARTVVVFKVRAESGIVYDFPDFTAVRKWLATRAAFDDLQVSTDSGATYTSVADHPELQDVKPTGNRPRTGALPAVGDVRASQSTPVAPTSRGPSTSPTPAVPPPRSTTGAPSAVTDDSHATGRIERTQRTSVAGVKDPREASVARKIPRWRAAVYVLMFSFTALLGIVYFMPEPDPIPNTPAGRHLRWVMDVINNGSARLTLTEVSEHMTTDTFQQGGSAIRDRLIALDEWRNEFAILQIHEPAPRTYLVVELATETGNHGYLAIGTEPTEPYRLNLFLAGSGEPPANLLRPRE